MAPVWLVHGSDEARDLCSLLGDLLSARGYAVAATNGSGGDDMLRVRASRNFIFVLSEDIFLSSLCLEQVLNRNLECSIFEIAKIKSIAWILAQLRGAAAHLVPLVPLRLEGARWGGKSTPDPSDPLSVPPVATSQDGTSFEVKHEKGSCCCLVDVVL